jgi:hypothetical protein
MTNTAASELNILFYILHKSVGSKVGKYVEDITWDTPFGEFVSKNYKELALTSDITLKGHLAEVLVNDDLNSVCSDISKVRAITDEKEINNLAEIVFKFYKRNKVYSIMREFGEDPIRAAEEIKNMPSTRDDQVEVITLSETDVVSTIQSDVGDLNNVCPSTLPLFKDSTIFNGYLAGQVIAVAAKPGGAKSAFLLQEAIYSVLAGKNVLFVSMGDLTTFDILSRVSSVVTNLPYSEVVLNLESIFKEQVAPKLGNRFKLIKQPSESLTIEQIYSIVESSDVHHDLVCIDYDGTLAPSTYSTNSGEVSTYQEGGHTYNIMGNIAKELGDNRVVLVASQVKPCFWRDLELGLDCLNDSSKKQHVIDCLITFGSANISRVAGVVTIAKQRRGKVGATSPFMMTDSGRISQIDKAQLTMMSTSLQY